MSQPADETRLGELLVTTGKLSSEELLAALEAQRLAGGPRRKRLGEILVERGHLSVEELQTTLNLPSPSPGTRETWPAKPTPGDSAEDVSEEIRQALADPSRCIGRYAKVEELGRGGMGVVYRCYDPQLHRSVAVKMILESEADLEGVARFKREARAVAKLQHPGIVALHEVGEHQGSPYLVMDFVEGRTLANVLDDESLSLRKLVSIICKIALALDHAHDAGIIHRDVKPENIIIDREDRPLLMDFGLARDLTLAKHITQSGHMVGTPLYMAPEQIASKPLGPWTDVHALGALLYHVLVGQPPYDGIDTPTVFRRILLDEPKPPRQLDPTISADLETITLKCLEKHPDSRYPSGAAVAAELQRFLDGQAILARPIGRSVRAARWLQRNPALSAALAMVVVMGVGALAGGVYMEQEAVRREKEAKIQMVQEAALKEQERAHKENETLLREVAALLDRVRSGEVLADPSDFRTERFTLLNYGAPETVQLITTELDELSDQLAQSHSMSKERELFLRFLCETLIDLRSQEGSVEALGRYLQTEQALPTEKRNQRRAAPAGKALCLLGGKRADRLLLEARDGFGVNGTFWDQVQPLYKRTGVEPELQSETVAGYINHGNLLLAKGDFDRAITDYTRAIEINPNLAEAWAARGGARKAKGDLDGAIADCTRAIEIHPNFSGTWFNRGNLLYAKGDSDGAIADFTRAIEIASNISRFWANRGNARMAKGDHDGAITDCTHAIEIDPNYASAWAIRGVARKAKHDIHGAFADISRAIEIDPNKVVFRYNRGVMRNATGDMDGAIADFTRAIEIDPNYTNAWTNRGFARRDKGDLDGAIADWQRFLELAPNHAQAPAARARIQELRAQQAGVGAGR